MAPRVARETEWRRRPGHDETDGADRRATLSRWSCAPLQGTGTVETIADQVEPCHIVTVALAPLDARFRWGRTWLVDGAVPAFTTLVTGPREHGCRAEFRQGADLFRIFLPSALIAEGFASFGPGRPPTALCGARIVSDDILTQLACSLLAVDDRAGALAPALVEGVSLAVAARLVALFGPPGQRRETAPRRLADWRLARVLDYVDAHFRRPISLDQLSEVAELSRIRFGAQFRAAMGVTPYAFILQRRVAYSQSLMREDQLPLSQIALMAGFSSQAHFTTVFRGVTGLSPGQWRRSVRG